MTFTLLTVECGSIQSYVFSSNRLAENAGASYLVAQATEAWALEALTKACLRHNVSSARADNPFEEGHLFRDRSDWQAEVIYFGGGSITILFRHAVGARAFTEQLSKKVLCEAPNLRLQVHSIPWGCDKPLGQAVGELRRAMKAAASRRPVNAPLLGMGVTAMCQETGLPALERTRIGSEPPDVRYLSAEVLAKRAAVNKAKDNLKHLLGEHSEEYEFPNDLDQLGYGDVSRSYIAVVHADGNDMGAIIRKIGQEPDCEKYIERMRAFSQATKRIAFQAMQAVIDLLKEHVQNAGGGASQKPKLPIRPIIFGGDDTTFVCAGSIGLTLAVEYLRAFEQAAKKDERLQKVLKDVGHSGSLTACAGVAIVKSHYPFARAYELSEELCSEAKKFRRAASLQGSALDWHFSTSGLYAGLEDMREREYRVPSGSLTLRPIALDNEPEAGGRCWPKIEQLTEQFQSGEWAEKRNKAKLLRDALREGPEAVKRFREVYLEGEGTSGALPRLDGFDDGWNNGRCGYFDALELMDIHIPLRKASES